MLEASDPQASDGLDCVLDASTQCGFLVDGPLRLKFDRWILPATATRQSLAFATQGTALGLTLSPDYDMATRVVSYYFDRPLPSGMVWELVLFDADSNDNGFGFRAFDGNALNHDVQLAFRTSLEPPLGNAVPEAASPPSCADVLSQLSQAGCSRLGCHSRQSSPECKGSATGMALDSQLGQCVQVPRMGLALDDVAGLATTAVNQVAHETQVGPDVSQRVVAGGRFGDQMPIIDIGRPENSYLIYKLLIGQQFNRDLGARSIASEPLSPTPLTQDQIEHARDEFIRFGAMPPDAVGYAAGASPFDVYTTLKVWIRSGAQCP